MPCRFLIAFYSIFLLAISADTFHYSLAAIASSFFIFITFSLSFHYFHTLFFIAIISLFSLLAHFLRH